MKDIMLLWTIVVISACSQDNQQLPETMNQSNPGVLDQEIGYDRNELNSNLPTIGILIFDSFLTSEVIAPLDVFAKPTAQGKDLFNVILIGKENKIYRSEEGLNVLPDITTDQAPNLDVLVVPSSYDPIKQQEDQELIKFIQKQHKNTQYTASHCAGAFLLAEAGIVNNKKVVTYVTGGEALQEQYPALRVMDDGEVSVMVDGKIISSNGALVSYIASLDLLEKLTDSDHRKYVEDQLYLDRLKDDR
ncbi:DJ-1/PfpI family protein [Fulvivirgaceae bacterium BMA10]|uniref:DJ-1/PfpI family protein n=1 Tax=Splendidivirga corallicola TaxID=3051826 RepID=A0ABT8KHR4_9BACT|nr:DJ-1/PfpI family protein [Fulvivirgaceae bacterium BMA10]